MGRPSLMGWAFVFLFLAAVIGALTGCAPPADKGLDEAIKRAELVRVCRDGTKIGRDPDSGRFIAVDPSGWRMWAWVAVEVGIDDICK